jgi:hypothetical protein
VSRHARELHRALDRAFSEAMVRDGGENLAQAEVFRPRRWRRDIVSGGRDGPRVLLVKLTQKRPAKGTVYLSGWMGAARLVAFLAEETDRDGNQVQVWNVYAAEPQPRADKAP